MCLSSITKFPSHSTPAAFNHHVFSTFSSTILIINRECLPHFFGLLPGGELTSLHICTVTRTPLARLTPLTSLVILSMAVSGEHQEGIGAFRMYTPGTRRGPHAASRLLCTHGMPPKYASIDQSESAEPHLHAPSLATQRDWLVLRKTYALRQPLRLDYRVSESHYSSSSWSLSCGLFIRALLTLVISSPVLSERQCCVKARRHVLVDRS